MRILFTGGGTLGSVTPLLALYEELMHNPSQPSREPPPSPPFKGGARGGLEVGLKAYWIGTRNGVERELIERARIPFYAITAGKLRRYFDWRNFLTPFALVLAFFEAFFLLRRLRPAHVLSAGGYVAVPVIVAATFLGIPSYAIQLDVRPGLANRLVAPFVKNMFVVFPETARFFPASKVVVTGSVVRRMIKESKNQKSKPPPLAATAVGGVPQNAVRSRPKAGETRPMLLVLGGGTGALSLNEIVWQSLRQLTELCDVVHITGPGKFRHVSLPHYESYTLVKDALPSLLQNADCIVTRAGMGTLSELAALAKAAIVVPLPETHQEENAALLARRNAAVVVQQSELTLEKLVVLVTGLLHDAPRRLAFGQALHDAIPTDGAEKIVQFLIHNS